MSSDVIIVNSFSARNTCPLSVAHLKMRLSLIVIISLLALRTLELNLIQASSFIQTQVLRLEGLATIIGTLICSLNYSLDAGTAERFVTVDAFLRIIKDIMTYEALEVIVHLAGRIVFRDVVSGSQMTL